MSRHLVMFSHNRRDTAFVRRVQSLQGQCDSLTTFTFRRDGEAAEPSPPWDNIDLGYAEHAQFVKRLMLYATALLTVIRNRKVLAKADVIHARNLDIFLFAWLASVCSLVLRKPMVYECLDVHEALTKDNKVASILRWLEKRVLNRSSLLIVSSPGFMKNYFEPVQKYKRPHYLAENKLFFQDVVIDRPLPATQQDDNKIITVAWVGIIRCAQTLALLKSAAQAMPTSLHIKISGLVSYFLIPDFDEQIAGIANIEFTGPYEWPQGLANAYADADFVWSQELSWRGHNSDWLIPNRVYEGSYFGVQSLALANTQTGSFVTQRDIGYTLVDDQSQTLLDFLSQCDIAALHKKRNALLTRDVDEFVASGNDAQKYLDAVFTQGTQ